MATEALGLIHQFGLSFYGMCWQWEKLEYALSCSLTPEGGQLKCLNRLSRMSWYKVLSFWFQDVSPCLACLHRSSLRLTSYQRVALCLHCCLRGMAFIKGLNSIYPRKWFRLLQPGKWALKPNAPQPTPHVERAGLVTGTTANVEQTLWLDKEPRALLKPRRWLAAATLSAVRRAVCVMCAGCK